MTNDTRNEQNPMSDRDLMAVLHRIDVPQPSPWLEARIKAHALRHPRGENLWGMLRDGSLATRMAVALGGAGAMALGVMVGLAFLPAAAPAAGGVYAVHGLFYPEAFFSMGWSL